jgi:hypothetical protein
MEAVGAPRVQHLAEHIISGKTGTRSSMNTGAGNLLSCDLKGILSSEPEGIEHI